MLPLAASESSLIFFVFILSFLGILRKYVDTIIRMHNTSNENREMMIILQNVIYFTKQNSENQEGNYGKLIFSFVDVVNLMYVLYTWKTVLAIMNQ